jgi:cell wall-associated NlpC family hydrolase
MAPDPQVIQYAIDAAKRAGADPVVFLASGLVESGLRHDAVGDGGTSFGAFQWHRGGALGSNQPSWTRTPDAFFERARAFASLNARNGVGAAAAQRPADRAGYARKVDAAMAQAKRLMQGLGLSGVVQGNELGVGGAGTSASATLPAGADSTSGMLSQYEDSPFAGLVSSNAKLAGLPGLKLPSVRKATPFAADAPQQAPQPARGGPTLDLKVKNAGATNPSSLGQAVVNGAKQLLGVKYVWGGESMEEGGFDCSGLVYSIYKKLGVNVPRVSQAQFSAATPVSVAQAQPGDLVFFRGYTKSATAPGHVAIYIGNGQYIEAPKTGDVVKVSSLANRQRDFVGIRRFAS